MTIYRQIYQKIIDDIRSGKLKPGEKLASIRKYADENGISCNSVQNAYNQLLEEGYIFSREKSGYYVADFEENLIHLQNKDRHVKRNRDIKNEETKKPKQDKLDEQDKQARQYETDEQAKQFKAGGDKDIIYLSANLTDSSIFPYETLRHLYRQVLSDKNNSILGQNGNFCGDFALRDAISNYLYKHRGIECTPDQIIIGGGTAALMAQLIKLFDFAADTETEVEAKPMGTESTGSTSENPMGTESTKPKGTGLTFFLETPCYQKTQRIIQDAGCKIIPLPLDENGAIVPYEDSAPPAQIPPSTSIPTSAKVPTSASMPTFAKIPTQTSALPSRASILLITPSHQFPLGITMPVTRRTALLRWASEKTMCFIIEDDYDSEFRYKGHPIPALQSMDKNGRVIYLGTFSRTLTPSMRINYAVLPSALAALYKKRFDYYSCPVPRIEQQVLSLFINGGYFERHINRSKKIYKARRDLMIEQLTKKLPEAYLSGTNAGLHFIMKVPDEENFIKKAAANNLIIQGTGSGWVIIGYAHLNKSQIIQAAERIKQTMED